MKFGFRISVKEIGVEVMGEEGGGGDGDMDVDDGVEGEEEEGKGEVEVIMRWLKGTDSVVFESFCGMVRKRVEEG